MTAFRRELRQYIALRRALGTRLQEPAATLERFLDFLERQKAQFITSELALPLGDATARCTTRHMGSPVGHGKRICFMAQHDRLAHSGSTTSAPAVAPTAP